MPGTEGTAERERCAAPLFSIVLPTRNRPEMLREAVDSVLAQTVTDWELLVVDDASEVPATCIDNPRISLIRFSESAGPAGARNAGAAAARGKYLAFLDDDDLYTPDRLEIAREGLQAAPVATCWMRYVDQPTGNNVNLAGDVSDSILNTMTPPMGATAVRREAFVPFDEHWRGVEDIDWWLRTAHLQPVATVPRVGYLFRRWHDPTGPERQAQLRERVRENELFLERHDAYFRAHRQAAAFRQKRIGLMLLLLGERRSARRALLRSLAKDPKTSTAWHVARTAWCATPTRR